MTENNEGVFKRWSRRKLNKKTSNDEQRIDIESTGGKAVSSIKQPVDSQPEVTSLQDNHLELPIWQQEDAEPELKQRALAELFRQPEFQEVDHMNEYDEDFTQFDSLGDIVTEEMKRMLKLAEEKTEFEALDQTEHNIDTSESAIDEADETQDKEDNNLA